MREIFVNLKRFDVSQKYGGLCPVEDPIRWIESVIGETVDGGLGQIPAIALTYLLPEGLVRAAIEKRATFPAEKTKYVRIGIQGLFREDVTAGRNFGAFTTNTPAAAAKSLGCEWALVGHSEERNDKLGIINQYDPGALNDSVKMQRAVDTVGELVNAEVLCGLNRGISIVLCVGETAVERGDGAFHEQKPRIEAALRSQLAIALKGVKEKLGEGTSLVIGYEPLWAIGPGKTPPGAEYIEFVASFIKTTVRDLYDFEPAVIYGGGLKEENATAIGQIASLDGGLIALTRFVPPLAFEVAGLKKILERYTMENNGEPRS